MDEELRPLLASVRLDTGDFERDVNAMRKQLEGPLADSAARAGRAIETALTSALMKGKLGFDDLKRVALSALSEIAAAAVRSGIGAILNGAEEAATPSIGALLSGLMGSPGRAAGGLVSPGSAYLVGERGPELFVPTSSGRIDPRRPGTAGDVRLSITINAPVGSEVKALQRSGRQVARAVKRALIQAD